MAFCEKCGAQIPANTKFCPSCGAPSPSSFQNQQDFEPSKNQDFGPENNYQYSAGQGFQKPNYQQSANGNWEDQDIANNKLKAVLSYFGILVLVPILTAKDSPYAKFHANQGLVLFICELILRVVSGAISGLTDSLYEWGAGGVVSISISVVSLVLVVASIGLFVLSVIGIIRAAKGSTQPLPLTGGIYLLK